MSENSSQQLTEQVKTVEVNVVNETNATDTKQQMEEPATENSNIKNNSLSATLEAEVLNLLTQADITNDDELRQKNTDLLNYLGKLIQLLKEKTKECTNLEKQNLALVQQSKSLKEVVAIVKDLLNIRNMELSHLQQDMTSMQEKINNERIKQSTMIEKMEHVAKLNQSLKEEYAKQYGNFQNVRSMYEEKVAILTAENRRLQNLSNSTEQDINDVNQINERLNGITLTLESYPPFDDSVNENVEK
ncbi:uncharacterized protein LOC142330095 [Lycorma delicatula]|uniref:uncharacterized protein LOC142330095 n=1 Tax=Lycorma delicatula TaxID=130591 RepID=UPI003F519630